jgi:3-oxocholest-4-en-26-oyl-CoA dehydrogenase beta subunit
VAPVPYLASIVLGAGALARFGTPGQQQQAAVAGRGEIILTAALAEEDGDDPQAPSVTAEPMQGGGGWRLSGVKTTVCAASQAGLMLVPAATPPDVTVFCVDPAGDGVTVTPQRITGGTAGRVVLDGALVPADRVLGSAGTGREITGWLLSHATVALCAQQLGVVERALETTVEYARHRVQFGKPIGGFQAVAQRLADGYIDVEAVRLTMWQAAWLLAAGQPAETAVATAKFWAADAGHRVAHTAVHVHGGMGIDTAYPLHRYFVAAKDNEFTLGGATAQLRRIGAALATAG